MINEFELVSEIAEADLEYLSKLKDREAQQSLSYKVEHLNAARRFYVRAFITVVESVIATFKQEALTQDASFTAAECAVLADVKYDLNEKGLAVERPLHARTLESIKFAFEMLAKAYGLKYRPDYTSNGWKAMQAAVRIRNRLTHPKNTADLVVSDSDMSKVDVAEIWFLSSHIALLKERTSALRIQLANAR